MLPTSLYLTKLSKWMQAQVPEVKKENDSVQKMIRTSKNRNLWKSMVTYILRGHVTKIETSLPEPKSFIFQLMRPCFRRYAGWWYIFSSPPLLRPLLTEKKQMQKMNRSKRFTLLCSTNISKWNGPYSKELMAACWWSIYVEELHDEKILPYFLEVTKLGAQRAKFASQFHLQFLWFHIDKIIASLDGFRKRVRILTICFPDNIPLDCRKAPMEFHTEKWKVNLEECRNLVLPWGRLAMEWRTGMTTGRGSQCGHKRGGGLIRCRGL